MTLPTNTDALIAQLEAATGPDRELDWLIAEAIGEVPEHVIQGPIGTPYGWFRREGEWSLTRTKESDIYAGVESWAPKQRTHSIDAALTLVEPGLGFNLDRYWIGRGDNAVWRATIIRGGLLSRPLEAWEAFDAPTPALAICIAALRAKQEQSA